MYILFVDLCKAYDSVPRRALWQVLGKSGKLVFDRTAKSKFKMTVSQFVEDLALYK